MLRFPHVVRCLSQQQVLSSRATSVTCFPLHTNHQALTPTWFQGRPIFTKCKVVVMTPRQTVQAHRAYRAKQKKLEDFNKKDNVTSNFILVYNNEIDQFRWKIQRGIIALSLMTFSLCAYHWYQLKTGQYEVVKIKQGRLRGIEDSSTNQVVIITATLAAAFLLAVHFSKRNLMRMYHDPLSDQYLAIIREWFRVKGLPFMSADVRAIFSIKELEKPGIDMDALIKGNISIHGYRFYTVESDYILPNYYNAFMGYQDDRQPDVYRDISPAQMQKGREREEKSFFYERLKARKERKLKNQSKND